MRLKTIPDGRPSAAQIKERPRSLTRQRERPRASRFILTMGDWSVNWNRPAISVLPPLGPDVAARLRPSHCLELRPIGIAPIRRRTASVECRGSPVRWVNSEEDKLGVEHFVSQLRSENQTLLAPPGQPCDNRTKSLRFDRHLANLRHQTAAPDWHASLPNRDTETESLQLPQIASFRVASPVF